MASLGWKGLREQGNEILKYCTYQFSYFDVVDLEIDIGSVNLSAL
jgi:hypothetical protein